MTLQASMLPSVLSPFLALLVLALLLVPVANAQEGDDEGDSVLWGHWSGGEGDSFTPVHPASTLCVQAAGPVHLAFGGGDAHPGYPFEPDNGPHCRLVMGGTPLRVEDAPGPVQVLVTRTPPRVLEHPGVTPLPDEGHAVRMAGITPRGEVTIAVGGSALQVAAFSWSSLQPLPVVGEGPERFVQHGDEPEVVVLVVQAASGQSLLRWSDPGWYPLAPDVGQALVPLALALMVSLFRGGAGGSFVRPQRKQG